MTAATEAFPDRAARVEHGSGAAPPSGTRPGWGWVVAAAIAVNLAIAIVIASGHPLTAAVLVLAPPVAVFVVNVVLPRPRLVLYAGLALTMFGDRYTERLPLGIGTAIYPSDVLILLALLSLLVQRTRDKRLRDAYRTPVLGVPFVLFTAAIAIAVLRGHEMYGLSVMSQPVRIVLYAAIAVAIADCTIDQLHDAIVWIFYAGALWWAIMGVYYLATGKSQTLSVDLSTGGTRALALSTAMLLACSLVLGLLNLELDTSARRRLLHIAVIGLALFGIVISLGRTTFAAIFVVLVVLLFLLRRARRAMLSFIPLLLPFIVLVALFIPRVAPHLGSTLTARFSNKVGHDSAVVTRERKYRAVMEDFDQHPVFGSGFGRPASYVAIDRTRQTFTGDPENGYVYLLAGGGIVLLASWIALIVAFAGDAVRRLRAAVGKERVLILWALSAWFVFAVNTATGPVLSVPVMLLMTWVTMLIPGAVRPLSSLTPETSATQR